MGDPAYNIETASFTDLGLGDDFAAGTLDPKWTAVGPAANTVDLLGTPSARYDLTTRPGTLFLQPTPSTAAEIRQDAMIQDGEQLVVAGSIGGTPSYVNNTAHLSFVVNDDDTALDAGNFREMYYDGEDGGQIKVYDGTSIVFNTVDTGVVGRRLYLRLIRVSGTLYFAFSVNGAIWRVVYSVAVGSFNNIWLGADTAGTPAVHPVMAFHWVRHTAYNGFDAF